MSKGSGRIQRAIVAAFAADPDNAFTAGELCARAYPGVQVDKKHRVVVYQATAALQRRWPDLGWFHSQTLGRQKVFFDASSVLSFAMARLKGDGIVPYAGNADARIAAWRKIGEAELRASLLPGGKHHSLVVEGGAWRRQRDMWIAKRDGDTARLRELEAIQAGALDRIGGELAPAETEAA
jgi:hypothetical protein